MNRPAMLALADGTIFHGEAIGIDGLATGEIVFNTAMSGYQEILTDPSYRRQLVTLTCPHIGNTGVNPEDLESEIVQAGGLIVRDRPLTYSSWRARAGLSDFLAHHGVPAIAGIDTRKLTRIIRERGAQAGCIASGDVSESDALAGAREFPGLAGMDLAQVVSTDAAYEWHEGLWPVPGAAPRARPIPIHRVVVYDFGVKRNILRMLIEQGCRVTVVPARTPAAEVLAQEPDGVLLSNGPGDPEPCAYAIEAIRALTDARMPVFGICLGHQLLALAYGARTIKMKFGHHGANHPVADLRTGRVMITSQNHGFAVDENSLPAGINPTHRSLFDGSLQGIASGDGLALGFQGHPEASPGPHDLRPLFAEFKQMMERKNQ